MLLSREELCKLWLNLDHPLKTLEEWSWPHGIIFESDPTSGLEAVTSAAAILGGHIEKFERHPVLKNDWNRRAGRLIKREVSQAALFESRRDKLCVIVLDLDQQPEWLQLAVKMPMDHPPGHLESLCVLATAEDASQIPAYVASHFFTVRKNGRRRGPLR